VSTDDSMVAISDLRFSWSESLPPVLDIEAFSIRRGERVFLRGPSGSGKTTLLSLMAAIAKPQAGTLVIDGVDLITMAGADSDRFRAEHIGLVFQQFNLLPFLSVTENVTLPCRFSKKRRRRAEQSGRTVIEEGRRLLSAMQLPESLFTSRSSMQLSVGQQQRVAVARALIGKPALVIADEPTSALDADARSSFLKLLFNEVQDSGATLLFVSHDASLASEFDRSVDLGQINRVSERDLGR
jgi:putative ABC transport system ATP-binding protein